MCVCCGLVGAGLGAQIAEKAGKQIALSANTLFASVPCCSGDDNMAYKWAQVKNVTSMRELLVEVARARGDWSAICHLAYCNFCGTWICPLKKLKVISAQITCSTLIFLPAQATG